MRPTPLDLQRLGFGEGRPEIKFVITHFDDWQRRSLTLLDGHFYQMHDEWYWMRLLNGFEVPGSDVRPIAGLDLRTVKDAYGWAKSHNLPLDLAWSEDGRLFSGDFYLSCLGSGRRFGIGSLLRVTSKQDRVAAVWVFQLEYIDNPSRADLATFFDVLRRALPSETAMNLRWLTRSAEQETLARQLHEAGDPIAERVLHLRDIVASDRVEVYSEGITAGQLRLFKTAPPTPGATNAGDIVVVGAAPDELPAAAGLITATPQTPLAHVSLLAKNRGIPNLYIEDAFTDPAIMTAVKDGGKAVLRAEAPNRLTLVPITDDQFAAWEELKRPAPLVVVPSDSALAPYSFPLAQLSYGNLSTSRALIGGKAAGYLLLASQSRVAIPKPALVITTRAYDEHLLPLYPQIEKALRDPSFATDPKVRFLLLEGIESFKKSHPGDKKTIARFIAGQSSASALIGLAESGGVKGLIRKSPIAVATMQRLQRELEGQFAGRAGTLRFRSSSTVEDIDGFNAAGLYESATGNLESSQVDESALGTETSRPSKPIASRRSVEDAIKKVWASYWGFVAFEERRRERVEHRSGKMAVLVHPRFADDEERANGVLTFTVMPNGEDSMRVAVQTGADSVTNPTGNSAPELVSVERGSTSRSLPQVKRLQPSSHTPKNVLSDAQLRELFDASAALTRTALTEANRELAETQRRSTFTLDIEFRLMASRAPQADLATGPVLVLKQARSLEPEPRGMLRSLLKEPVARDLLTRARRVERFECQSPLVSLALLSLFTDVKSTPDMGYRERPFTAWVRVEVTGQTPVQWLNREFSRLERPKARGQGAQSFVGELSESAMNRTGWRSVQLDADQLSLVAMDGRVIDARMHCSKEVLFTSAEDYLLDLIRQ